jgi:hypothetical protein
MIVMQSALSLASTQMSGHVLAIRFVGVDRISILDAAGEVGLVERRCRQRTIRSVELSGLKVLAEDGGGVVVGVASIEEATRIARDVSSALSSIPPVAGIRLSVGCGYTNAESSAVDADSVAVLVENARAAARRALDDQLVVVEGTPSAAEAAVAEAQVLELTPGVAVDRGVDVLYVAFNNQITNLSRSGQRLVIGRADRADIRIDTPSVSRQHGRISFENGKAYFTDLSTNGSRVISATGDTIPTKKQTVDLGAAGQIIVGFNNGAPVHPPIRYVVSRTRGSRADRAQEEVVVVELDEDFEGLTTTRVI